MARKKPADAVPPPSGSPVKRYTLIAVPIVAAAAAFFLIFWPQIQVGMWINGLHSDEPEIKRQMRENLINGAREDPAVIDQMAAAISDDDRGFNVRQALVGILIDLGRTPKVVSTYENGSLMTRAVILARLQREREFDDYWAKDQSLKVQETIREWLGTSEGSLAYERAHAVQIAMQLEMADTMPMIRPLLVRSTATVHEDKKRDMLIAASAAVEKFGDCESLPTVFELAQKDPNFLVRVRATQNVDRAAFGDRAKCGGTISDERMQQLVARSLQDETKEVRMVGMLILEKRPAYARNAVPRLKEILAGKMPEGMQGTERRHALHALIGSGDTEFLDTLPKYFFDPNPSIRSSCAHKATVFKQTGPRLESCLIGLARNEVEAASVFNAALETLRRSAGKWHGLPPEIAVKARDGDRRGLVKAIESLFATGSIGETTRDQMVEAWFRWFCGDLGLDANRTTTMLAAWKGFWAAADKGDAAGARAALAALPSAPAGLFTYEQTWLALNEK
ncbi:MAG: hypothetical protein QNJ98_05410 [Planctomycetota bacterium]|nr:hypothetical protein [Planctomycetota bacterium]